VTTAQQLREAYHWSGSHCWPDGCPGVDECCYAEDDGTGPASVERWEAVAAQLNDRQPGYHHPECGFRWSGKDGLDVPLRDGEPICPRCELALVEKRTLHRAWLRVHVRRHDKREDIGGPDSIYRGVQLAEDQIRELWHATGDLREIGSLDTKDVASGFEVNLDLHRTDNAIADRLAGSLRSAMEAASGMDVDRRNSIRRMVTSKLNRRPGP
jgi:hypothetical protein